MRLTRAQRSGHAVHSVEGFDLALRVSDLGDVAQTAAYRTLVHGKGDRNAAVARMESRSTDAFSKQMPPLASEEVDTSGVAIIRAWAESL